MSYHVIPEARGGGQAPATGLNVLRQIGDTFARCGSKARTIDRPAIKPAAPMTNEEERELRTQLARLLQEHRDLDAAIAALHAVPGSDLLQVQRLKKRKLQLRDRIAFIEDQLTPDIIA